MQYSTKYIFLFSAVMCLICSLCISVTAVSLREKQQFNEQLKKRKSVLQAGHLVTLGQKITAEEVSEKFKNIEPKVIDLATGDYVSGVDAATFEMDSPENMQPGGENIAKISEVPKRVQVFQVMKHGKVDMLILPIYGKGLWSTLYGFLALKADGNTIAGLTYYKHGETPGLGGEVDNPRWKNLWVDREVYGQDGDVAITVIKGAAGPPQEDPHRVDGLSGATLTSRGVSNMLHYWLGEQGYKPYLDKFRAEGSA